MLRVILLTLTMATTQASAPDPAASLRSAQAQIQGLQAEVIRLRAENERLRKLLVPDKVLPQAKSFKPGTWAIHCRDGTSITRRVSSLEELVRIANNRRLPLIVDYDDSGNPIYVIVRSGN